MEKLQSSNQAAWAYAWYAWDAAWGQRNASPKKAAQAFDEAYRAVSTDTNTDTVFTGRPAPSRGQE